MRYRIALTAVRLSIVVVVAAACAAVVGPQPTTELTTMNPAWINWFKLDWAAEAERSGTRRVKGYVHNGYGEEAADVQILAQAFDAAGAVVGQRITWAGNVPSLSRSYFEVRNLPEAEQYKVTIWSFTFQQRDGWD